MTKRLPFRTANRIYAFFMGYFWLPCPFPGCVEYFGGHECGEYSIPSKTKVGLSHMTCKLHDDENRKEVEAAGLTYYPGMKIVHSLDLSTGKGVEGIEGAPFGDR